MFSSQLLTDLGWSNHFLGQLTETELDTTLPARLTEVHRDRASALTQDGPRDLNLPGGQSTGDLAVGDWCLFDAETGRILRVLDRKSRLARRAAGEVAPALTPSPGMLTELTARGSKRAGRGAPKRPPGNAR